MTPITDDAAEHRNPVDLGHNFVLADSHCNAQKGDHLPAYLHLAAWVERNAAYEDEIADLLGKSGIVARLAVSNRITHWAYAQVDAAGGLTWLTRDEMVPLEGHWRVLLPSSLRKNIRERFPLP